MARDEEVSPRAYQPKKKLAVTWKSQAYVNNLSPVGRKVLWVGSSLALQHVGRNVLVRHYFSAPWDLEPRKRGWMIKCESRSRCRLVTRRNGPCFKCPTPLLEHLSKVFEKRAAFNSRMYCSSPLFCSPREPRPKRNTPTCPVMEVSTQAHMASVEAFALAIVPKFSARRLASLYHGRKLRQML